MKQNLQAVLLLLLVVVTAPLWIPCLLIWAGVHKHELDDIDLGDFE